MHRPLGFARDLVRGRKERRGKKKDQKKKRKKGGGRTARYSFMRGSVESSFLLKRGDKKRKKEGPEGEKKRKRKGKRETNIAVASWLSSLGAGSAFPTREERIIRRKKGGKREKGHKQRGSCPLLIATPTRRPCRRKTKRGGKGETRSAYAPCFPLSPPKKKV